MKEGGRKASVMVIQCERTQSVVAGFEARGRGSQIQRTWCTLEAEKDEQMNSSLGPLEHCLADTLILAQ